MTQSVTTLDLYQALEDRLELEWLSGRQGQHREVGGGSADAASQTLVGSLNFIHPNRIQIVGASEQSYLSSLDANAFEEALKKLLADQPAAIVVAGGVGVHDGLIEASEKAGTPLLRSSVGYNQLITNLQYYLTRALAERVSVHGVFMEVMGMGVLLTGESAIGKSELALELVSRGHRLIADDVTELAQIAPDIVSGSCPAALREYLEVRGLGIVNIRAMFGDSAIKQNKYLRLIIDLQSMNDRQLAEMDRLEGSYSSRKLLGVPVPRITIPVAPGRNLAILVEVAVRNHILRLRGYDAAKEFSERQQRIIDDSRVTQQG